MRETNERPRRSGFYFSCFLGISDQPFTLPDALFSGRTFTDYKPLTPTYLENIRNPPNPPARLQLE